MEFDDIPLDSGPSDFEQDGEDLAVYMNSQIARATFEAELNAIADGELCGPTPRFGKWTEAHELMAEVESPSYMSMDNASSPKMKNSAYLCMSKTDNLQAMNILY